MTNRHMAEKMAGSRDVRSESGSDRSEGGSNFFWGTVIGVTVIGLLGAIALPCYIGTQRKIAMINAKYAAAHATYAAPQQPIVERATLNADKRAGAG